jgi:hypothetical protein
LTTHPCHRANGDVTVHAGPFDDCGICTDLAALGLLSPPGEDAVDDGQDPAAPHPENSRPHDADPAVASAIERFAKGMVHAGFVPSAAAKAVELLPELIATSAEAYRSELHQQILELVGFLGGKIMEDFMPAPGELDNDGAYDVGFQVGVAAAFTVAAHGTTHLTTLVDPDNHLRVRTEALRAASDGRLQEVLLEDEEKEPE